MTKQIEVEKTVAFLEKQKLWSISLYTPEPYGEFYPKTIYVSAIFHKKLDKALGMAWAEFNRRKEYQDNNDAFYRSKQTEKIMVPL